MPFKGLLLAPSCSLFWMRQWDCQENQRFSCSHSSIGAQCKTVARESASEVVRAVSLCCPLRSTVRKTTGFLANSLRSENQTLADL